MRWCNPGDVIVADQDGVVVVPRDGRRTQRELGATAAGEGGALASPAACGRKGLDMYGLREKLKELGVEYVD